jgi:uncharacterized protein
MRRFARPRGLDLAPGRRPQVRVSFMADPILFFVAAVYVLAGLVKGVIGLGMPAIAMGLLAIVVAPVEAAAILILPALVTNIWQMLAGPHFAALVRRLWPMLAGVVGGTLAGTGWLVAADQRFSTALLGITVALYGASGLWSVRLAIARARERWLAPLAGASTGLIGAATGVFVIPGVPYLQAIGLEKDALVQGLGIFFTVSMVSLGLNLAAASALNWSHGPAAVVALAAAAAGMRLGQILRTRLEPKTFQRLFFIGMVLIGVYLVARSVG